MVLYAVDTSATSNHKVGQNEAGKGGLSKRDLAARDGPEKNESEGSEVGKMRGHFEEILPTKSQSQARLKRHLTSHPNFAIQYGTTSHAGSRDHASAALAPDLW